mgnify:CR=1 FL=1
MYVHSSSIRIALVQIILFVGESNIEQYLFFIVSYIDLNIAANMPHRLLLLSLLVGFSQGAVNRA